jgi:hypothetical protein
MHLNLFHAPSLPWIIRDIDTGRTQKQNVQWYTPYKYTHRIQIKSLQRERERERERERLYTNTDSTEKQILRRYKAYTDKEIPWIQNPQKRRVYADTEFPQRHILHRYSTYTGTYPTGTQTQIDIDCAEIQDLHSHRPYIYTHPSAEESTLHWKDFTYVQTVHRYRSYRYRVPTLLQTLFMYRPYTGTDPTDTESLPCFRLYVQTVHRYRPYRYRVPTLIQTLLMYRPYTLLTTYTFVRVTTPRCFTLEKDTI